MSEPTRRRCGTGVPLDQLAPGDRAAVEAFSRYLGGDMSAEERATYERGDQADAGSHDQTTKREVPSMSDEQLSRDEIARRLTRLESDYDYAEKADHSRDSLERIERAHSRLSERYDQTTDPAQ